MGLSQLFYWLHGLPRGTIVVGVVVTWFSYLVARAFYRLFLSPLSKFPGPKLASITTWYELYYDVVKNGQFSFHIEDLHRQYGPVVRISPFELHLQQSEFWETLHNKHPNVWKYSWWVQRFGMESSTFSTCDPALHRLRRAPLNPMFSTRALVQCNSIINERINYLSSKLVEYKEQDKLLSMFSMWSAFTGDVITQYSLGFHDNQLGSDDFVDTLHDQILALLRFSCVALQFPFMNTLLDSIPDSLVQSLSPSLKRMVLLKRDIHSAILRISQEQNQPDKQPSHPTIFHEILQSDLPASEKTARRLGNEGIVMITAGLNSTAWSLTTAVYYILADPKILERLRAELFAAIPDMSTLPSPQKLETLPYLRGCVREGIRLSHAIAGRSPRLLDVPLEFGDWVIPPYTPVSMSITEVHSDENVYPNADQFVPERWLGNPKAPDGESLEKYFVAFGKGPRNCLGINLAYMELFVGLATFFRRFRSELYETDITDVKVKHDFIVPAPKMDSKGVRVKIVGIED